MNMSDNQPTLLSSFSGDIFFQKEISRLVHKHSITSVVETGTYLGDTAIALARMVPTVITIENNPQFAAIARNKSKNYSNIKLLVGNSPQVLHTVIPTLRTPTMYFLDAHWYNYWPLLDELTEIARNPKIVHVIIIHDFYVPGTSLGYDSYINPTGFAPFDSVLSFLDMTLRPVAPKLTEALFKKQKLDLPYITNAIKQINPKFSYHYNTKATGKKRGIIFIEY